MLVVKSCKRYLTDGKGLPSHDKIRPIEEKKMDKYLGILEAEKQVEMKDKIK